MTTEQTHTWTFENQLYYPLIGEGDLSPDGRNVVFTVQEPIMTAEASKFVSTSILPRPRAAIPAS
jgi:hypothetical protein